MPLIVALWPNRTVTFVYMQSGFTATDLYHELDQECDPLCAKCYVVGKDECDSMYVTTESNSDSLTKDDHKPDVEKRKAEYLRLGCLQGRKRRYRWPRTVVRDYIRSVYSDTRMQDTIHRMVEDYQRDMEGMPIPPSPKFSAKDVRGMEPFSGVYVSWNDDGTPFYVGESKNVPERVNGSRPEIGERRIGVLRCDEHDRKRLECFFIGLLNPPGNSQSTHRMQKSTSERGTP